jgi:hypothetical protein
MSEPELDELAKNIKEQGFRQDEKIVLLDGKIIDGRNRYLALKKVRKPQLTEFRLFDPKADGDPASFVLAKNILRRHLTPDQRAMIAAKLYAKLPKQQHGGDRKSSSLGSELENAKLPSASSQKEAVASQAKVSVKQVERAAAIQKKDPKKAAEVQAGTKKMVEAEKELNEPQEVKGGAAFHQDFGEVGKLRAEIVKLKSDNAKLKAMQQEPPDVTKLRKKVVDQQAEMAVLRKAIKEIAKERDDYKRYTDLGHKEARKLLTGANYRVLIKVVHSDRSQQVSTAELAEAERLVVALRPLFIEKKS